MRNESKIIEFIPRLRRYAYALYRGNETAADDLVQDCIERALRNMASWQQGTDLRAWLFTIMHNLYVNQIKRMSNGPNFVDLNDDLFAGLQGRADNHMLLRDLEGALNTLPPDQKEILLLVTLEGMSYREVADIMDIPEGTVMSRLSRARQQIRKIISGEVVPHIRRVK
ncbi:MAG: RNA polymerase sigma factor [Gammaproteobacteria bacterium]|nr:RNA polymerase sigma factor [Gammaproteobacteria bacterium]MDH5650593.1 RNA polymerase sigma factor [Gammaproteobacteria bacterium]